jgi:hypothetical protein
MPKNVELIAPQSLEELEALLAEYKKSNPVKYALKEANGEFDAQRALLGGKKEEKKEKKLKS